MDSHGSIFTRHPKAQLSFVYPFSQHNKKSQQNLSVFVLGKGMVAGS